MFVVLHTRPDVRLLFGIAEPCNLDTAAVFDNLLTSPASLRQFPGFGGEMSHMSVEGMDASVAGDGDGTSVYYAGGARPAGPSVGRLKYQCRYCAKILSTNHGLRRHIDDKHTVHMHAYRCYICGKDYKTPNSLQNHMYVYHKRKECNQRLATW